MMMIELPTENVHTLLSEIDDLDLRLDDDDLDDDERIGIIAEKERLLDQICQWISLSSRGERS
jgi:hypothetical protein